MSIFIKYALTPSLAISTMLTGIHYGSLAYIKTESQFTTYISTQIVDPFKASIRSMVSFSPSEPSTPLTRAALIQAEAAAHGINPKLILALIDVESNGKRDAERFEPALNTRSIGLTQVLIPTAKAFCPAIHWTDLYQEAQNIRCGTSILASALQRQPTLYKALVEYNGGVGCLKSPNCLNQASNYATKVAIRFAELSAKN